jgi:putative zinc finger protein/anti-sigma-K factor RskA
MDCARVRELLEEYALDALEPSERAEVERHLAGCPDCPERARELEALAGRLPGALAAASALQPPTALREQVLAAVDAAEQPRARRRRSLPRRALAIALAAALPALALGWLAGYQQASAGESDRRNELARMLGVQELVFEVVDSRVTEKAFLRSTREEGPFARSYGKLYTRPDLPHVVAFAARLPEAREGTAYHLWLTAGDRTRLAGTLTVRDGFGLLVLSADERGPSYDSALLTLQPRGATAPGGTRVLSWRASEAEASATTPPA